MNKVIALVVGAAFAAASFGSVAANTNVQPQGKTPHAVVHKVKAKHGFHHVKAKKHHVRHAKKAHRTT